MISIVKLQAALNYQFKQTSLLEQALTHRSYGSHHNERLEFLGDSVLNFVVAALLFERFTKVDEGDLSRLRANLVKQSALADIANALKLSDYLRLGEGELKSGGFRRPSILADTLEAVFGAIFLDAGFDAAQKTITGLYIPILQHVDPVTLGKDPKTLLQELLQGCKFELPTYTVVATHGAAHDQMFDIQCAIPRLGIEVVASGSSRRSAEQIAASQAIAAIQALGIGKEPTRRGKSRKSAQLSLPVAISLENK